MHKSQKPRRIPDHILVLGGFAAIAAVAAYAFHARPDVQRPAVAQRAPVAQARSVADTPEWRITQQRVLGIREVDASPGTPVVSSQTTPAPVPGEYVVAERAPAPTVTRVEATRQRSHAQPRRHARDNSWPSGAGGAPNLASLPAPGD